MKKNSDSPTEFHLDGHDHIELKNLLKVSGLCETGGQAKIAIDQGEVTVDGLTERTKALKLKPGQTVGYKSYSITIVK